MTQTTYKPFVIPATQQKPNKKAEINRLFYFVGGGGKKVQGILPYDRPPSQIFTTAKLKV